MFAWWTCSTQLQLPTNARVIGFVGRITKDKGIVELARAWQQLSTEFDDLHLLIVGGTELATEQEKLD